MLCPVAGVATLRALPTPSTDDLAWTCLTLFGFGICLWLAFGFVERDPAVISAAKAPHRLRR